MERVSWIFNGDFEKRLFENHFTNFQSTKETQEFEYFIHLLEPDKTIFSNKKYSEEYKVFLKNFTGKDFKVSSVNENVQPWCNHYENPELLKKFQLKQNLIQFLLDKELIQAPIEMVSDMKNIEEGFLYKYSKSLSGGGHLKFPKDEKRIIKLLNKGEVLLKEKENERVLDFSTLVLNNKVIQRYENIIDKYFQYKGTIIDGNFCLPKNIEASYELALKEILNFTEEYKGHMSIDSYLYSEKEQTLLFPACELNVRRTMGFVAYKLKTKYFSSSSVLKLGLFKNKMNDIDYEKIQTEFGTNVFLLSPKENRFLVFAITANSREELDKIDNKLLSTFF